MAEIIITGVSGGIGKALCQYFLTSGPHSVTGISRSDQHPFGHDAEHFHPEASYHHCSLNLTQTQEVKKFGLDLQSRGIRPDILINNAGMMLNKPFLQITQEEVDQVLGVNLKGPFMLIQAVVPQMPAGGHIVNITSMGGFMGSAKFPGLSLYSASKGGLSVLTEALAEELKGSGIIMNAIAPGSVQTEMLGKAFPGYRASVSTEEMAAFIGHFALTGHRIFNGKVLPAAITTP